MQKPSYQKLSVEKIRKRNLMLLKTVSVVDKSAVDSTSTVAVDGKCRYFKLYCKLRDVNNNSSYYSAESLSNYELVLCDRSLSVYSVCTLLNVHYRGLGCFLCFAFLSWLLVRLKSKVPRKTRQLDDLLDCVKWTLNAARYLLNCLWLNFMPRWKDRSR